MKKIKRSAKCAIIALFTISVVFLCEISPLEGLGILTFFIILAGIVLWVASIVLLIEEISVKPKARDWKKDIITSTLLIISFIPISVMYVGISQYFRTKITVDVVNRSGYTATNIIVYGTGNIFDDTDTLRVKTFNRGEKIKYIT